MAECDFFKGGGLDAEDCEDYFEKIDDEEMCQCYMLNTSKLGSALLNFETCHDELICSFQVVGNPF